MAQDVDDMTRQTIFRKSSEAKADRTPKVITDEEVFMKHAKTMKRQRWQ